MKSQIKAAYLTELIEVYPEIYSEGSRPLELAKVAADNALSGKLKLEGRVWEKTVKQVTGWPRWTRKMLSALPD